MDLTHYANVPVTFDPAWKYDQSAERGGYHKPRGLWVSVDGEDDWPSWCRNEEYGQDEDWDCLRHAHRVVLADGANILHISSGEQLDLFHVWCSVEDDLTRRMKNDPALSYELDWHGHPKMSFAFRQRPIDWANVTKGYDGIIIAPYLWSHRLFGPQWYYGWDCASGCIWNLAAVESFSPLVSSTPDGGAGT